MSGKYIKIVSFAIVLMATVGCEQGILDTESGKTANASNQQDLVLATVKIKLAPSEYAIANYEEPATKTALHAYDTSGILATGREGKWHPVEWKEGDRIYSYAQTGVFMDYILTDDDILSTGTFIGEQARTHILYRVGDTWVTCYCKGPKIGSHIGFRRKEGFTLANGVPREQTGVFSDYHICLAQNHPDEDFVFEDMQGFIRFETTGSEHGELVGYPLTKITVEDMTPKSKMAGNLEILYDGGWRCSLVDRGEAADSIITVKPAGGFAEKTHWFVAVPPRRFANGLRFNLFTMETGSESRRGYVELPGTTVQSRQIFNAHDLLTFCVILIRQITPKFGGVATTASAIKIVKTHTAIIETDILPTQATNKALLWEVVSGSEVPASGVPAGSKIVSVEQNGHITGVNPGTCTVKVSAKDGSGVFATVNFEVTDNALGSGDYTVTPYTF